MKINIHIIMMIVSVAFILIFTSLGVYGITNGYTFTGILNIISATCWFYIGILRLKQYLRER